MGFRVWGLGFRVVKGLQEPGELQSKLLKGVVQRILYREYYRGYSGGYYC